MQPRTAEVFDLRGMMDQLLESTLPRELIGGHFGGLPVELDCRPWNTRHPYPVPIPHERVEQLLTERLADYDVAVRHGHELTALHPDDDGVTATVHDRAAGSDLHIRARYLVACDGGHSTVRTLLGVPFPGQAGTMAAVLARVRLASVSDLVPTRISQFAAMVRDGGGYWSMLSPPLEGDLYRLVFGSLEATIADQRRDSPVEADEIRHALHAVWGPETELGEITWSSRFRVAPQPGYSTADIVTDLARLPDTNRYLAGMMSGLDVRYPIPSGDDHPLLGARMPDVALVVDGVATRLSALMHTGRGLLLDLTGNDHLADALDGQYSRIDLRRAHTTTTDIDFTAALLRPDGHICWLSTAAQRRDPAGTGLHAAIKQWFEPGVAKSDTRTPRRSSSRSWRTGK